MLSKDFESFLKGSEIFPGFRKESQFAISCTRTFDARGISRFSWKHTATEVLCDVDGCINWALTDGGLQISVTFLMFRSKKGWQPIWALCQIKVIQVKSHFIPIMPTPNKSNTCHQLFAIQAWTFLISSCLSWKRKAAFRRAEPGAER